MKKALSLVLALITLLFCLTSCNQYSGKIDRENKSNCIVIQFDNFCGTETMKAKREISGEGTFYYQANLTSGALSVSCYVDSVSGTQSLFSAEAGEVLNGNAGYVERDGKIEFTFEADTPVSGEVIIAFSSEALEAVHKDKFLHEHTYRWETTEETHKRIYTCDCDYLGETNHEPHCDDDENGYCDECEYFVGIPHDEHNYEYDVNETSHRLIFGCGCESPKDYEAHYNNDGDDLCDACGYEMSTHIDNSEQTE